MKPPYDITDHGAVGDGATLSTRSIQAAVDACAAAGGGTVRVPPGVFLTGSIRLRSQVTFHIENGGVLRGSGSLADYPPHRESFSEFPQWRSLLWAEDEASITLCGDGCIDLNDAPFMQWELIKTGDTFEDDLVEQLDERQRAESTVTAAERPNQCLCFHRVRGLRIRELTLRRAPSWTVCIHDCDDIRIQGIAIFNHLRVPNSDGIHLCCSRDAVISGCILHCGDDCVALTGISNWATPCENIVVTDCTMISRSAGLRIGHLKSQVRNVTVSNLVVRDSQRGIGLFAGDGGCVEHITIANCVMQTRMICGHWWGNGEPLVISAADSDGVIRKITVRDLDARGENGVVVHGRAGNVHDVDIRGLRLALASGPNRPLLGTWIDLQPAALRKAPDAVRHIPWLYLRETGRIRIRDVSATAERQPGETFSVEPDVDGSPVTIG